MNVIIVDDDRTTVEVIEQNMDWKALGIEGVYTAYNIAGAKKIIEAHPIDIVISDIEMPKMDGHRLCKLVKDDDTMRKIPFIIFSSLINNEIRRKGESLGADAQLTKPEIGKLVQVIDELVEKYESARQ